jgi:hypothetical protein
MEDPAVRQLYQAPLALIRPDQHIAWRGRAWPDCDLLMTATGRAAAAKDQSLFAEGSPECRWA